MKPYRKECVLAPLFKLLEALLELFVPLVVASIIDYGIRNNDVPYILRMCLLLAALAALGLSVSITAQYFSAKAASLYSRDVKAALFRKIESLGKADLDNVGEATLITRMTSDMNLVQNGVNMTLRLLLRSPFVVFGAAIMAFTVDVRSAMVFAVTIPLLALSVALFMALSLPRFKKVQALLDKVLSRTRENLVGVRVLRAFALEETEEKAFREENGALYRMQVAASKISILTNPVTSAIINLSIIALLYFGAINVDTGSLSQGELVALINYMNQILVELIKLANLIITITKALNSAGRISSVLSLESSLEYGKESTLLSDDAIAFDHVSFAYSSGAKDASNCNDPSGATSAEQRSDPSGATSEGVVGKNSITAGKAMEILDREATRLEKQALMLYLGGLTYRQISVALETSEKSVDNAIFRAKRKLRKHFGMF